MRPSTVLLALLVTVSSACSSSPPGAGTAATVDVSPPPPAATPPAASPPAPGAPAGSTQAPPPAGDLAGTWASASCGSRTYERVLDLRADGTFTASDRVSPCPPGAQCVWSGIIVREGTWASAGGRVALTVTKDGKGPTGQALPASLAVDAGALVEDAGGQRCPYARR